MSKSLYETYQITEQTLKYLNKDLLECSIIIAFEGITENIVKYVDLLEVFLEDNKLVYCSCVDFEDKFTLNTLMYNFKILDIQFSLDYLIELGLINLLSLFPYDFVEFALAYKLEKINLSKKMFHHIKFVIKYE
jgi:hypothetical protein